jgi:hypothetical protein
MDREPDAPSRWKRRLVWVCAVVGVALVLVLTPPLLNVNRLQRRIAASMSASLGRPVTLDRVTLHLLPVPGFTLQNLVVGEDPGFGSEPVIRANAVDVTLRPSSLWRRRVEISSIKFEEPSLNLVRNARGEWNLQSLLMHAASVDTAPTGQRKAGPEPRFPYIEASGARVNLKLGEEKKPFSLTGADFALWLSSPQVWRVRLEGQPARTDRNISDPGTVRLEGTLERAATMAEVPVDLTASWEGVPLGEASTLLSGEDAGWRGNLTVAATLVGRLGAGKLATRMHFEELRRADFVPVETMDVHAECGGTLDVTAAVVESPDCSIPAQGVHAAADSVDLSSFEPRGLRVGTPGMAESWLMDWARLFSQRIPTEERGAGVVAGSLLLVPGRNGAEGSWNGEVHGDIGDALPGLPGKPGAGLTRPGFSITSDEHGAVLEPVSLTPPGKGPGLMLSGMVTKRGYSLRLVGSATEEQVAGLRGLAPPLGDGLEEVLPKGAAGKVVKVDVGCSREWGAGQSCGAVAAEVKRARRR